ncbi:MAG: hypothetical protein ACKVPY_01015 [Paracoccaceae bacterium]
MEKSLIALSIRLVVACMAAGMTVALPAQAEDTDVPASGPAIYGPSCRMASCWAVVVGTDGQASVIRARGYIATQRLAEREAKRQSDATTANHPPASCLRLEDGLYL